MKAFLLRRASVLAVPAVTCAWTHLAMAQGAPPPGAAPAVPPAAPPTVGPAIAPLSAQPPSAAPPATPAAAATPKWYEKAKVEGFVDAYSSWNFNFPKPQFGTNIGRAFDATNGFALHWAGINASYAPDPVAGSPVGGFVGLRFGPGAFLYNSAVLAPTGFTPSPETTIGGGNVKEAYVSWKPDPKFQIDIGKFSTWIGAEVADSQYNMTYTRSALFFTQPAWHTGIRIDLPLADQFDLKLFVVNGYNSTVDNNAGKTVGVVANFIASKDMSFYLNYIGGPEYPDATVTTTVDPMTTAVTTSIAKVPDANSTWRHLVDAIADMHFDKAHLLVNADFGVDKLPTTGAKSTSWYGGNATFGYAISDQFGIAVRGGYLADPDGFLAPGFGAPGGVKTSIIDATLTLAATPTPNLIIKIEPRIDSVTSDATGFTGAFPKAPPDPGQAQEFSKTQFTAVIGAVVTTN